MTMATKSTMMKRTHNNFVGNINNLCTGSEIFVDISDFFPLQIFGNPELLATVRVIYNKLCFFVICNDAMHTCTWKYQYIFPLENVGPLSFVYSPD